MILQRKICSSSNRFTKSLIKRLHQRFTHTNVTEWKPTVGLEIHAQIMAESKLFSDASTSISPVNTCVSLFDSAVPGTMPVLNRKCVEAGVLTALALSCDLNSVSMFERKHYFYADLPAGFQITQQKRPLAVNGEIVFHVFTPGIHKKPYFKSSKIKQIQLEQDSGKSLHIELERKSLIDLNRAGVPLMELVFEPDLADGEEAAALVKELALTFEILKTCSCKMQEGALRVDANVSVSKSDELGVRTELKNIGSVRAVADAIRYEINRQISVLSSGQEVVNETRAWNMTTKKTISMREKEEKHDYRFMPETNLPLLHLHVDEHTENHDNLVDVNALKRSLPELPKDIRRKLQDSYGLTPHMIIVMMNNYTVLKLFRDLVADNPDVRPIDVANILTNEVLTFIYANKLTLDFCFNHQAFITELIKLKKSRTINGSMAIAVLGVLLVEPHKMPKQILEEKNWHYLKDESELEKVCLQAMEENPKAVRQYRAGAEKGKWSLLRRVEAITDQRADMHVVSKILERMLT